MPASCRLLFDAPASLAAADGKATAGGGAIVKKCCGHATLPLLLPSLALARAARFPHLGSSSSRQPQTRPLDAA
jgi:hypothetical protein